MNPNAPLTNAVEMRILHEPADDLLPRHQLPRSNQLTMATRTSGIDLFWLPLGAGGRSVRFNGIVFEALSAKLGRRPRSDLYHSALDVRLPRRGTSSR
jgi:hypothetical protein